MTLSHEQVLPSVVVVIEEAGAPTGVSERRAAQSGLVGHIRERAVAVVLEQHVALVRQIRDNDVRPAVVVEVGEVRAHPSEGLAVLVVADAGGERNVCECAVAVVAV